MVSLILPRELKLWILTSLLFIIFLFLDSSATFPKYWDYDGDCFLGGGTYSFRRSASCLLLKSLCRISSKVKAESPLFLFFLISCGFVILKLLLLFFPMEEYVDSYKLSVLLSTPTLPLYPKPPYDDFSFFVSLRVVKCFNLGISLGCWTA